MPTMDFPQQLREVALRVTRPRLAVLGVLAPHPQAVYDCLNALTDAGLVRRIQPAGSTARYELRVGDNHHHLVCRGCGCVVDVECATGSAPCLDTGVDHGFAIDEAEVNFWGLCPQCQIKTD